MVSSAFVRVNPRPVWLGQMKRDLVVSGFIALLLGAGVYSAASALSTRLPILLPWTIGVAIAFSVLLLLSLAEIPMMLFALRQMARGTTSRRFVVAAFAAYVAFASVYASIFVLLTGQVLLGLGLAALGVVRFATGALIRG